MLNSKLKEIYISSDKENKTFIPKEYILLFIGAFISLLSSFGVIYFNNKIEKDKQLAKNIIDKRNEVTKAKIAFTDELCKNIATRITVVGSLYNSKLEQNDIELKKWLGRNEALDTFMYARTYYYPSRLKVLFGDQYANWFRDSVDVPFDKLEEEVVDSKQEDLLKINMKVRWPKLDTAIHNFTRAIYTDAFKDFKKVDSIGIK